MERTLYPGDSVNWVAKGGDTLSGVLVAFSGRNGKPVVRPWNAETGTLGAPKQVDAVTPRNQDVFASGKCKTA